MKCYECGKNMSKIDDKPESYECECGYAMRCLTKEKSSFYVKMILR